RGAAGRVALSVAEEPSRLSAYAQRGAAPQGVGCGGAPRTPEGQRPGGGARRGGAALVGTGPRPGGGSPQGRSPPQPRLALTLGDEVVRRRPAPRCAPPLPFARRSTHSRLRRGTGASAGPPRLAGPRPATGRRSPSAR